MNAQLFVVVAFFGWNVQTEMQREKNAEQLMSKINILLDLCVQLVIGTNYSVIFFNEL